MIPKKDAFNSFWIQLIMIMSLYMYLENIFENLGKARMDD